MSATTQRVTPILAQWVRVADTKFKMSWQFVSAFADISQIFRSLQYPTYIRTRSETPSANKLFDIFGVNHGVAALKLKEIQQSKRVDDDGGGCVGGGRRRRSGHRSRDLSSFDVAIRHQCRHRHPPPSSAVHCLIVVLFVVVGVAIVPSSLLLLVPLLPLSPLLLMSP